MLWKLEECQLSLKWRYQELQKDYSCKLNDSCSTRSGAIRKLVWGRNARRRKRDWMQAARNKTSMKHALRHALRASVLSWQYDKHNDTCTHGHAFTDASFRADCFSSAGIVYPNQKAPPLATAQFKVWRWWMLHRIRDTKNSLAVEYEARIFNLICSIFNSIRRDRLNYK